MKLFLYPLSFLFIEMNGTDFKIVFVMLNNCLISIKSGDKRPRNIGDFMPDYNLWYALKFMTPEIIIVLDNSDLTRNPGGLSYAHSKIDFITKWLSQVVGINEVYYSYSPRGDWKSYCFPESQDILETIRIRRRNTFESAVFIDDIERTSEEYIKTKHPELVFLDKTEFIKYHNKNPRVYEKKSEIESEKSTEITGILGRRKPIWTSSGDNKREPGSSTRIG